MTTKNSSYSRIVAVWLVLLAFLCGVIVPSLALANQEMDIAMEGDPRDGLDFSGGGGGGSSDGGDSQSINNFLDPNVIISQGTSSLIPPTIRFFIVPIWVNGQLHFFLVSDQITIVPWRSN